MAASVVITIIVSSNLYVIDFDCCFIAPVPNTCPLYALVLLTIVCLCVCSRRNLRDRDEFVYMPNIKFYTLNMHVRVLGSTLVVSQQKPPFYRQPCIMFTRARIFFGMR